MMKLYAPAYYQKFACIADKCRHSCCIGWEIDVDCGTAKKYKALNEGYGKEIAESISFEETPHFVLGQGDRCPHLNEAGLCKIILSLGEDYLCEICREHPRFYHDAVCGKEVGLGMACEEACRLILTSDDYQTFAEIGELEGEAVGDLDFDASLHRTQIYSVLSDATVPYATRLQAISEAYGISLFAHTDEKWKDLLASLEYLNDTHRDLFACYSSDLDTPTHLEKPLERALAYFIFRHCTETYDIDDFCASLGFALFCERLLASVAKRENACTVEELILLAQAVSEELEYSEENTEEMKLSFE